MLRKVVHKHQVIPK